MFCKTTETAPDVWGLPVVRVVSHLRGIKETLNGSIVYVEKLTAQGRNDVGWFDFTEETVDQTIYERGASSDDFTGGVVTRTYPAKTLKPAADQIDRRLKELDRFAETVTYGGMIYTTQPYATDNLTLTYHSLVSHVAAEFPDSIRDLNGVITPVNPAQYNSFRDALASHVTAAVNNRDAHAAAINALSDPQAIVDYDITTGWPANPAA